MLLSRSVKFLLIGAIAYGCINKKEIGNAIEYVDPFIGTDYHGHTYPGATLPFGMVQLSPDTRTLGWDACAGYHYSDSSIIGFSHTHLSGTGIGDYGDILFMPFTGNVSILPGNEENPDSGYRSRFQKSSEVATPGYYKVFLEDYKIKVELTATKRVGMHRYTYPEANEAGIIIDLAHTIHGHENIDCEIRVINTHEIEGLKHTRGWANKHFVYFRANFSVPFEFELYLNDQRQEGMNKIIGNNVKAKLKFKTKKDQQVQVKVGISGVDFEGAARNLDTELSDWNFQKVVADAEKAWKNQLGKIIVKGNSENDKKTFYTSLYHASLTPNIYSDVDGRYRGMEQKIHQSESPYYTVFSLWDTYRALHPLFTIISPDFDQELIRSLIKKYEEGGILPMWDLASNNTGTMIGSHSIPVIADAYIKGLNNFDREKALEAMINSVEYDSVRNIYYPSDQDKQGLMPKAKLYDKIYGFVPNDLEIASVSKGLEFAYNYWCIATMANEMGKKEIADEYYQRAMHYKEYFDSGTGFMRGKNLDGTWQVPFDPRFSDHWKTPYVEGNAWQWSWYVPQDVEGLIRLYGGKEKFATKLDSLFTVSSEVLGTKKSLDITGLIGQYAHGNEPSHHIAYLFNYADRPWRTQELVAKIRSELYSDKPDGLCGNEDCGQMSAWYIFNAMGFYPVCPGSTKYSIGTPLFDEITIPVGNDKAFTIKAKNRTSANIYVYKVLLDGQPLKTPLIDHSDITAGKTLEFEMGPKPAIFWQQ